MAKEVLYGFEDEYLLTGGGDFFEGGKIHTKLTPKLIPKVESDEKNPDSKYLVLTFSKGSTTGDHRFYIPNKKKEVSDAFEKAYRKNPNRYEGKSLKEAYFDLQIKDLNTQLLNLLTAYGYSKAEIQKGIGATKDLKEFLTGVLKMTSKKENPLINVKMIFNKKGFSCVGYDKPFEQYVEGQKSEMTFNDAEQKAIAAYANVLSGNNASAGTDDDLNIDDINSDGDLSFDTNDKSDEPFGKIDVEDEDFSDLL